MGVWVWGMGYGVWGTGYGNMEYGLYDMGMGCRIWEYRVYITVYGTMMYEGMGC